MSKKSKQRKSTGDDEENTEIGDTQQSSTSSSTSYYKSTKRFVKRALFGSSNSKKRRKEKKRDNIKKKNAQSVMRHTASSRNNAKSLSRREIIERNSQDCSTSDADDDDDSSDDSSTSSEGDDDDDFEGLFSTARMPDFSQMFTPRHCNNGHGSTGRDMWGDNAGKKHSLEGKLRSLLILGSVFSFGCTFGSYRCISFQNYYWTVKDVSYFVSLVLGVLWFVAYVGVKTKRNKVKPASDDRLKNDEVVQHHDISQTVSFDFNPNDTAEMNEMSGLSESKLSLLSTSAAEDDDNKLMSKSGASSSSEGGALSVVTEHINIDKEDDSEKKANATKETTGSEPVSSKIKSDSEVQIRKVPTAPPSESLNRSKKVEEKNTSAKRNTSLSNDERLKQQHPDISKLIILTERGSEKNKSRVVERIVPNSGTYPIDNEFMHGEMHLMLRTPDVDDPKECEKLPQQSSSSTRGDDKKGPTMAQRVSEHFRGKQRQFEFHFQFRFKKPPVGPLYIGFELDTPLKLGMIQRAFVKTILGVIRTLNPFLHYSFGDMEEKSSGGKYENTHLAFTLESGMDRIVISKSGTDDIPKLNQRFLLEEDDASVKSRKRGTTKLKWNTEETYTLATWNAYASYLQWKALNLPGIRPFSISNVTGEQPFKIVIYALRGDEGSKFHYRKDMDILLNLELFHKPTCSTEYAGRLYEEYFGNSAETKSAHSTTFTEGSVVTDTDDLGDEEESFFEDDDLTEVDSDEDSDTTFERDTDAMLNEVGEGSDGALGGVPVTTPDRLPTPGSSSVVDSAPDIFFDVSAWIETVDRQYVVKNGGKSKAGAQNSNNNSKRKKKHVNPGLLRAYAVRVMKVDNVEHDDSLSTIDDSFDRDEDENANTCSWVTRLRTASELKELVRSKTTTASVSSSLKSLGVAARSAGNDGDKSRQSPSEDRRQIYREKKSTPVRASTTDAPSSVEPHSESEKFVRRGNAAILNELKNASPETKVLKSLHRSLSETDMTRSTRLLNQLIEEADEDEDEDEDEDDDTVVVKGEEEEDDSSHVQPLVQANFRQSYRRQHSSEDLSSLDVDGYFHGTLDDDLEQDPGADMFQTIRMERKKEKKGVMDYTYGIAKGTLKVGYKGTKGTLKVGYKGTKSAGKALKRTVLPPNSTNNTTARSLSPDRRRQSFSEGLSSTKNQGSSSTSLAHSEKPDGTPKKHQSRSLPTTPVNASSTASLQKPSSKLNSPAFANGPSAAKLSRPDESMQMVCKALDEIMQAVYSNRDGSSSSSQSSNSRLKAVLNAVLTKQNNLDYSFLKGDASSIGVIPCATRRSAKAATTKGSTKKPDSSEHLPLAIDGKSDHGSVDDDGMSDISGSGDSDDLQFGSLIARALWESHWREEWCGIYSKPFPRVDVYAPFSSTPSFSIALADICNIRCMDDDATWDRHDHEGCATCIRPPTQPLAGYPVLVLETVWRCHYFAFVSHDKRQDFHDALESLRLVQAYSSASGGRTSRTTNALSQFTWQSFYTSIISTHCSHGRGKWAAIASSKKAKRRTIFNKRRLPFDTVDPFCICDLEGKDQELGDGKQRLVVQNKIASFVENTLSMALSLDPEDLDCEKLLIFLDRTSQLQNIPLHAIDFNGTTAGTQNEAFCIFINLFHCLLQHSLLLSAHGPPNRRSVGHFMRCSCYELGNDVFSLSEIECFVLRGKLSAGIGVKPPFVSPPLDSAAAFRRNYAVAGVDARVNFLLNYGTKSCLSWVPVYTPDDCVRQIDSYCSDFLEQECFVDASKKKITLPRVCQIFYRDFLDSKKAVPSTVGGGESQLTKSAQACLQLIRSLLDDETRAKLTKVTGSSTTDKSGEEKKIRIKYQPACCDFYSKLKLKKQSPDNVSSGKIANSKKRRGSVGRKVT